jgi:hypothetical protein
MNDNQKTPWEWDRNEMGELYLDDIDKILLQEHRRFHDGWTLKETASASENSRPEQHEAPPELWSLFPPDDECACVGNK